MSHIAEHIHELGILNSAYRVQPLSCAAGQKTLLYQSRCLQSWLKETADDRLNRVLQPAHILVVVKNSH